MRPRTIPQPGAHVSRVTATLGCLALTLAAAPAVASGAVAPQAPAVSGAEQGLDPIVLRSLRSLHDPEGPEQAVLLERIQKSGPLPLDDLLRFLETGRIDAYVGQGSDTDPMDGDLQLMNRYQEQLILALLDAAGSAQVVPALERMLERSRSNKTLAAAILGLGAVGNADDLRSLFELVLPLEVEDWIDPQLGRALEKGVAAILRDDPSGFDKLAAGWRQLPSSLVPAMLRAIGATADGRGVEILGQVVVWEPDHASLAVSMMRRLGPSPSVDVNARIAAELRARLEPTNLAFCRAALLALAELEDYDSVPVLIDLLETAPAVEENALWALQKIAGRKWANSPGWWRLWYEDELTWKTQKHPHLSRQLRESTNRDKLVSTLRDYGTRRLYRDDLAFEVVPLLSSPDRPVRLLAIETLKLLEASTGIDPLIELLQDDDEMVRNAALHALRAMTGESHTADSPQWLELHSLSSAGAQRRSLEPAIRVATTPSTEPTQS